MRRVLALVMAAALLLVAVGCDGDGGDELGAESDGTEATSGDSGDGSGGGSGGDSGDGGDGDDEESIPVEYPAGGPVDSVFPPGDKAYKFLSEGDCEALLAAATSWESEDVVESVVDTEGADTISLYRAAGAACQGEFAEAASALAGIGSPPDFLRNQCSRGVVLEWVRALVEASQDDPDFDPEFVPSDDPNPCPDDEGEDGGGDDDGGGGGDTEGTTETTADPDEDGV